MLSHHIWSRSRISRIVIYAIFATTIILISAAGSNAAAFSSPSHKRSDRRTAAPLPVTTCTTRPSGMVGWWPGNGNSNDIINGNNGTLVNGVTYAPGMVGQAFSFNQASQQYIDVPDAASQLLNNNAGTIAVWVNPSSIGDNDIIVAFGTGNNGEGVGIGIYGTVRIYHHTGAFDWQTSTPVSASTWTYLVYTWDGTTETLYKNGVFAESRARNFNYVPAHSRIGYGFWNDPANFFPGQIDEVAIFNRTLSSGEVSAIYNAGSAGVCPNCSAPPTGLTNWWPANGNADDIYGSKNAALFNGAGYVPGLVGQAFNFDGIDDYGTVPASSDWAFGTGDFTVELWMYSGTNDTRRPIVNNRTTPASNSFWAIEVYQVANRVEFHSGLTVFLTAGTTLIPSAWNHVAVTRSGTTLTIYINGVPSGSVSNGTNFSSINDLQIGRDVMSGNDLGGNSFQGQIDELSIYRSAATAAQIAAIYNAGSGGKCNSCTPAPVGMTSWWTGDGNALDSRGVNNGTLQNGATYATGKVGQAFNLDGTDDYLSFPSTTSLDVGMGDLTIDMWINLDSVSSDQTLFHKVSGTGSSVNDPSYFLEYAIPNTLRFRVGESLSTSNDLIVPANLVAGIWYHVSAVRDGTTNRIYLNGALLGSQSIGSLVNTGSGGAAAIGRCLTNGCVRFVDGMIDEVELLSRALSQAEIQAIVNASSAGKCKPTATTPPAGLVAWWGGDGDATDLTGNGNNGSLLYGAAYAVGKVGQAFDLRGSGDYVQVATPVGLPVGAAARTMMLWFKTPNTWGSPYALLMQYGGTSSSSKFGLMVPDYGTRRLTFWGEGNDLTGPTILQPNTWYHGAVTYDGATVRLYLNGQPEASQAKSLNTFSGSDFTLGRYGSNSNITGEWDGLIDEADIYNRELSLTEIQSVYNAGIAGKLKQTATAASGMKSRGTKRNAVATNVTIGDAAVSFPSVTNSGMTQQIPLDPATLPPLPLRSMGLTYDIATSARYTGTPTVCFNLPSFTTTEFATLHILHLENGGWIDATLGGAAYPSLCTVGLTSLSPFAIVTTAPTAAELSIAGRVVTAEGRGIRGAFVTVTATDGNARTVPTGNLGRYVVDGLNAGETYIVTVRSRRFSFAQPTRVITLNDNVTDADFIGSSGTNREQ